MSFHCCIERLYLSGVCCGFASARSVKRFPFAFGSACSDNLTAFVKVILTGFDHNSHLPEGLFFVHIRWHGRCREDNVSRPKESLVLWL